MYRCWRATSQCTKKIYFEAFSVSKVMNAIVWDESFNVIRKSEGNMRLSVPSEALRSNEDNIQTLPSVVPCSLTIRVNSNYDGSSPPQETTTRKDDGFSGINVINCLGTKSSVFIVHNSDRNSENNYIRTNQSLHDQIQKNQSHSSIEICVQNDNIENIDETLLVGQSDVITCDETKKLSENMETENSVLTIGNQLSNDGIHMDTKIANNQPTLNVVEPRISDESAMAHNPLPLPSASTSTHEVREQRRRQRRERRQGRTHHIHPMGDQLRSDFEVLPDLLHSHLHPPPYTTLPFHPVQSDFGYNIAIPVMRRSPSERSAKGCCGHWFSTTSISSFRALIAFVALSGVATALGGAALGASGASNIGAPPSSHFTASLLMIAVGVILITISGAAWRMTVTSCLGHGNDSTRYGRINCTSHGLLYPEFQHRPPPPSYQASMQEYRLRLLLLGRDRQGGLRNTISPPPTYRSVSSIFRAPLRCISGTLSRNNQNRQEQRTVNNLNGHNPTSNDVNNIVNQNISTIITNSSSQISTKNLNRCHQTKRNFTNRTQLSITQVPASRNSMETHSTTDVNNLSLVNIEKNVTHKIILQNISTKHQNQEEADEGDRVPIFRGTVSQTKKHDEIVQLKKEQKIESNGRNLITVVTVTGCMENSVFHNNDESMNQKMEIIAHL